MYRRYYQRFNEPQGYPQRPMGEEVSNLNEEEEINTSLEEDREQEEETEQNIAKPEIVVPEKPTAEFESTIENRKPERSITTPRSNGLLSFFNRLKIDDLLIIALILILISNQCDDELLIMILIFLFFIGF